MRKLTTLALVLIIIIPIYAYAQDAKITVENVTAHPEEETTIGITADEVPQPGIASIQGSISFDPQVVQFLDLVFSESYNIAVKNAQTGSVKFAATLTAEDEPITAGMLLELRVKAVGQPGDESEIDLTLEVLSDLNYQDIPHTITDGVFKIEAPNQQPVADFTYSPPDPRVDERVTFDGANSSDPDGEIVKYEWDFDGDGSADAEGKVVEWSFAAEEDYTVTLTVTDDRGATATKTEEIFVAPAVTEPKVIVYPNPARDWVKFRYYLPRGMEQATLMVFDLAGAPVFSHELDPAETEFTWDLKDNNGNPLPNGLYFFFIRGIDRQDRATRSSIGKLVIQR